MECLYFITLYNNQVKSKPDLKDEQKIEIIKSIIHPVKYKSFEDKSKMIIDIIKRTVIQDANKLRYNSCDKYYTFITELISQYTDLTIVKDSYDLLCANGLLNLIIGSLGSEYDVCLGIMEMYMTDLECHHLSMESL